MAKLQDLTDLTESFIDELFEEIYDSNSLFAEFLVRLSIGEVDGNAIWGKMPLESIPLQDRITAIDFALSKFFVNIAKNEVKHAPEEVAQILERFDFDFNDICCDMIPDLNFFLGVVDTEA